MTLDRHAAGRASSSLDADPHAHRAGVRQPAEQRRQVHAARRPHRAERRARSRASASWCRCATTAWASRAPMLERVFDMFTQVDRSHAQIGGGLGIGLTLVRQLVEMHGGSVDARSDGPARAASSSSGCRWRRAGGRRWRAARPRCRVSASRRGAARDRGGRRQRRRRREPVDDADAAGTRDAHRARRRGGARDRARVPARCDGARHRDAAASAATSWPGASAAKPGARGVLLIAASGWGQAEDKQRSLDAGFDHHLVKPVEFDALGKLLGELL